MATKELLVTYYTGTGNTKGMTEKIGIGGERPGAKVEVKSVQECGLNDLAEADGIVIGARADKSFHRVLSGSIG